jgi:hypothetical protein
MKLVKLTVGCILAGGWLSAAPAACVTGTLADYIALGAKGCTLNGDVLANFSYSAPPSKRALTITADQIIVAPLVVVPATASLNFSGPWSVSQDQTQESVIQYTIVPPPGLTAPSQLRLTLGTARITGIIGSVKVEQTTNLGSLNVFDNCTEVCQAKTENSLVFEPVSVVLITHHVRLSGGTGGASLNGFSAALDRCILCV